MPEEGPQGENDTSLESTPREETVWEELTKDRLEGIHSWVNRIIFNTIGYFPYGFVAETLVHPKAKVIKDLSYKTRLKIYNYIYGILQYGHYISTLLLMLAATVPYEKGDVLDYLKTIGGATSSALLSLHIKYNRQRVKRIMETVAKKWKTGTKSRSTNKK